MKTMPVKNFLCSKCGTLVKSKSTPNNFGCLKGGNFHSWRDLGHEGEKGFYCKGCLTLIHSNDIPTKFGCPNEGFHDWEKIF
ncbi:MAG: hypothetical protein HYU69_12125 [Bacteroidetes bacterium]|nr:hypothetical protein [Bacteroidota bacterium]